MNLKRDNMHYIHSKTGGTSHFTGGTIYIPILPLFDT